MITHEYKYTGLDGIDEFLVSRYSDQYTSLVHLCFNHLDKYEDPDFRKLVYEKYNWLNAKMYDYAYDEALQMHNAWVAQQKKLKSDIKDIEKTIKSKKKKTNRTVSKLKRKLDIKKRTVGKAPCFGSRKLRQEYDRLLNKNDPKAQDVLKEYRKHRNLGFRSKGDASYKGSRHYDFSEVKNDILIFTPANGANIKFHLIVSDERKQSKDYKQLIKAVEFALDKKIPVSIRIKEDSVFITYDNNIVEHLIFQEKCKAQYDKEHQVIEALPNRIMAIDLNPERIGYCILDLDLETGKITPVTSGCFEYSGLTAKYKNLYKSSDVKKHTRATNERNYWLSVIIARLGRIAKHYRVSQFAVEDLDFKRPVYNKFTKQFNRLTNNMWNRTLIMRGINKFCQNNRIDLILVSPEYSSVIGNFMHRAFDPISASAEIGRRCLSMLWYHHNPHDDIPIILQEYPDVNDLCLRSNLMYGSKIPRDIQELYKYLCTSGSSYRRPLIKNQMCGYVKFNKGRIVHWTSTNTLLCFD